MLQVQSALGLAHLVANTLGLCPPDIPVSCRNTSIVQDTCCFNSPGGAFMQTQLWDTNPSAGPKDSWTIHGLWPDNCDGTYAQFCDPSREYNNISAILTSQGRDDLLAYMYKYWPGGGADGDDESFWAHEWNKHGTCINTIERQCYTDYQPQEEVGQFFATVVKLFKSLDTYKALLAAGIRPSKSKTYSRSDIENALSAMHGEHVVLVCQSNELRQVYYYFDVQGNAVDGKYIATRPLADSGCTETDIRYLPKI